MTIELIKSVLVLVAGYLVRLAFDALGVALDEATFNAIVGALVSLFLGLFGLEAVNAGLKRAGYNGLK